MGFEIHEIVFFFLMWVVMMVAQYFTYQKGIKVGREEHSKEIEDLHSNIVLDQTNKLLYVGRGGKVEKFDVSIPSQPRRVKCLK